jgi:heme-degrading monooxygenase HmoA
VHSLRAEPRSHLRRFCEPWSTPGRHEREGRALGPSSPRIAGDRPLQIQRRVWVDTCRRPWRCALIVASSFVPVQDGETGSRFEEAMQRRSHMVETFPGFRRFEFHRTLGRNPGFLIVTWWDTMDDLRRYMASADHRATHARLSSETRRGLGRPVVEVREVLETTT